MGHLAAALIFALALADRIIVQTGPLGPEEAALAAAGVPVLHFLYLAPLLLVISAVTMVVTSLLGEAPDPEKVRQLTWTPAFFREETRELAGLPWYLNYRIQIIGMLALIALFVGMFW